MLSTITSSFGLLTESDSEGLLEKDEVLFVFLLSLPSARRPLSGESNPLCHTPNPSRVTTPKQAAAAIHFLP